MQEVRLSEQVPTDAGALAPPAVLLQMMTGYWVSQALYVAAKLSVADLLADGPRPGEALETGKRQRVVIALQAPHCTPRRPGADALRVRSAPRRG
jgi:hypothetical protein